MELSSPKINSFVEALSNQESILIEELWNAPKAFIGALARKTTHKHVLILTGASQEEIRLYHDFSFFTQEPVVEFPAWETLPSEQVAPSPDIVGERYKVLRELATTAEPYIILTSLQACLQRIITPQYFNKVYLKVRVGDTIPFDDLIARLAALGYQRYSSATDKGQFAVRGGIIDVFPVSTPDPYRIEFWGDEVTSLRTYDPIGQNLSPAFRK